MAGGSATARVRPSFRQAPLIGRPSGGVAGDDYLDGYVGDDCVDGGSGNDQLFGRDGRDILDAGASGSDILHGNGDDDRFIIAGATLEKEGNLWDGDFWFQRAGQRVIVV